MINKPDPLLTKKQLHDLEDSLEHELDRMKFTSRRMLAVWVVNYVTGYLSVFKEQGLL